MLFKEETKINSVLILGETILRTKSKQMTSHLPVILVSFAMLFLRFLLICSFDFSKHHEVCQNFTRVFFPLSSWHLPRNVVKHALIYYRNTFMSLLCIFLLAPRKFSRKSWADCLTFTYYL